MKSFILACAVAAIPFAAAAHEMATGPNGGPVADSAGRHIEMVASGAELVLYLTGGDDKPLASAGSRNARAVVQDGGKTTTVPLQPAAPNKLVGALVQPLSKGARVVVSATLADGHPIQARFVNN